MKLAKVKRGNGNVVACLVNDDQTIQSLDLAAGQFQTLADLLCANDIPAAVDYLPKGEPMPLTQFELLPPIDQQEVWAAGVTYRRSQTARMEESEAAASCYDQVYEADRPELFFKATPHRVSGEGQVVRIRKDAAWSVPEPEITLVLNRKLQIVGYTIGNDMSSRDIEGENPLYLPQAKVYDQCAGLGPWITLAHAMPPREQITVSMHIIRDGDCVFEQSTDAGQMARQFDELARWLARDNSFPNGAFLMTGTGIVPDSSFTLAPGDTIKISIAGIGTLSNSVVQG